MKTANILSVAPFGYIHSLTDMHSGAVGSRARLLYAAMLVGTGVIPSECLITIFPQGYRPNKLTSELMQPLGTMMVNYLSTRPELRNTEMIHESRGWGTEADIRNTCLMVREKGFDSAHISFVSDPEHIKRIELIWKTIGPDGWTASFYAASFHQMPWFERVPRELIARWIFRLKHPRRTPCL